MKDVISQSTIDELTEIEIRRGVEEYGRLTAEAREIGYAECPDCGCIVEVVKSGKGYYLRHIKHRV